MKIVFIEVFIVFPGTAFEYGQPVVGRLLAVALAPEIIIVIRIVGALAALLEPFVLAGGMIDNEIHKDLHAAFMSLFENHFEIVESAEFGIDILIIGNIVAVVAVGGGINRREPDAVNAEALDIIKLAVNARQIADTVAVAVAERAAPDLIDRHFLEPFFSDFRHFINLRYQVPLPALRVWVRRVHRVHREREEKKFHPD